MSDKAKATAKTSEPKSENSVLKKKRPDFYQNLNSPIESIFFLQRTAGNQAVGQLLKSGAIQAKLKLSQPGDKYEREADLDADKAMGMPKPAQLQEGRENFLQTKSHLRKVTPISQLKTEDRLALRQDEIKPEAGISQRKKNGESEEARLQAKETPGKARGDASEPGQILEQLKNVQPTNAIEAYDQAKTASPLALAKQKQNVEQSLPTIPAPTGIPPQGSGRKEKGVSPLDGEKAQAAFEGEKSGKEGEKYETNTKEAPPPSPVMRTVLSGGEEKKSGEGDAELSRSAQNSLEGVQLDINGIGTSAGERPAVDTTGESDPAQLDSFESESSIKVQTGKSKASKEINRDFGENDIFPEPSHEMLKARKALSSQKSSLGKGGAPLSVPEEAIRGLNRSLGPILRDRVAEQKGRYDSGQEKFENDSADVRADANKQIADLNSETCQKQMEEQAKAKAGVAQSRLEWQAELDGKEQDYQKKAGKATQEQKDKIEKEKQKGEKEAAKRLDEAEKKADAKKADAEKEALNKKQQTKSESKGFWGWVKSKASALIDGLKKAINFIYDSLRQAVKLIFEAAKKLVKAAIELARLVIVGLIKGLGLMLKGLVTIVFVAFPEIRRKIISKIDKVVNIAVKGVNKAAEYLKKGVEAVLDFLSNTLDKILGLIQSLYNGIFTVIGMIIRGEFKELIERIGSLVKAAKQMPSHLEGAVWEQLIGVDISKPMPGEAGYVPAEGAPKESEDRKGFEASSLIENDVSAEPVAADALDQELIEDLDLQEGEEKVLGERSGEAYSLAGILADFPKAESGISPTASREAAAKSEADLKPEPTATMGRAERAAKVWDQIKTFMNNWLKANWGKLLLAVIGALAGLIAATILTGGAILAALPIIMKIVTVIFVGLAIMKAMEYLKTYLSEGWEKRIIAAAKGLAGAIAVGIVEFAMALGFRAIGAGLKAAGKIVKSGVAAAVTGVKRAATATASVIKSVLKSGATLASKSGSAMIRGGKLIFKGLERGFSKGIKKAKDFTSRLFAKLRFRKFKIARRGRRIQLFGFINPWILLADGNIEEVTLKGEGGAKLGEKVGFGRKAGIVVGVKNAPKHSKSVKELLEKASDPAKIKENKALFQKLKGMSEEDIKVLLENRETTYQLRKGIEGLQPPQFQAHHLIPRELRGVNKIKEFLDKISFNFENGKMNGIMLPNKSGHGVAGWEKATIHIGSHPNYTIRVKREMETLAEAYNNFVKKFPLEEANKKFGDLMGEYIDKTKMSLLNGSIKLN